MSPRTKEQFEDIRSEKLQLITRTALSLFSEYGYEATSVSMIAKKAEISKGLLYNYFKSKEDLLKQIVIGGFMDFARLLVTEDDKVLGKKEILHFIDENLVLLKSNREYYKLYFSLILQPKVFSLFNDEVMKFYYEIIQHLFLYYQQKGEKNAMVKARYLLAIFDGVGMHYIADPEGFPLDEVSEMMKELL